MTFHRYLLTGVFAAAVFLAGFYVGHFAQLGENTPLLSPFSPAETTPELPLLQYTIPSLSQRRYSPSALTVSEILSENPGYTSYLFSYLSGGRKITGQLNIPAVLLSTENPAPAPVILMLRGFVPEETYTTGTGTENAAAVFAENGYITIAPDFLGYGGSDAEPADVWEARFIKPVNVIELIFSLRASPSIQLPLPGLQTVAINSDHIGIWAHSNGGQVALTALEILGESLPAALWAPVTAPFPYSVLFYTDENEDEGKQARAWIAQFERDYDARQFSLTQYLNRLAGPLQLHHGTADEAALKTWSDEFTDTIETENARRRNSKDIEMPEIELTYFEYPGADHNLQPGWNTAVQRDLSFFAAHFR